MKKYINPSCDIIDVAPGEFMTMDGMSLRIFDNADIIGGNDILITDGSEILSNHNSKLWDDVEEDEWK